VYERVADEGSAPGDVVALLVVALLSIRGVRPIAGPLEMLIDGTRRAGNQDFSARLGDDELGELATSFNSMASRLGSQFSALTTLADIDDAILSRHELARVVDTAVLRMREIVAADLREHRDRRARRRRHDARRDARPERQRRAEHSFTTSRGTTGRSAGDVNGVRFDAAQPLPRSSRRSRSSAPLAARAADRVAKRRRRDRRARLPGECTATDEERLARECSATVSRSPSPRQHETSSCTTRRTTMR
jgi:HAMP domain-containing protein